MDFRGSNTPKDRKIYRVVEPRRTKNERWILLSQLIAGLEWWASGHCAEATIAMVEIHANGWSINGVALPLADLSPLSGTPD
ncbi:MAG: hypothetical protein OEV34_18595, partial [Gammaproteobacteria bacterium]|nr:hypothetical protein [Gammaproteobacteria bacterium]